MSKSVAGQHSLNNFPYRPEFRQKNRKNNEIYASCYALYLTGKSLQYIAEVHYKRRFTRQSLFDVFKVRGYKMRTKPKLPTIIYKGIKFTPDQAGLYRSTRRDVSLYLHRLVWEEQKGQIPKDFVVIHKDNNKANNTIENLDCLHREEVKKLYNYSNQFGYQRFKGKGSFGL